MNYYPFHIGDYAVHTRHLSLMEDLAYRRLLDLYYTRERGIPAETQVVCRLLGMRDHATEVESVLAEFFTKNADGEWVHARCDEEIARAQAAAERARTNGKAGGRPPGSSKQPTDNPAVTQPVASGNPEESKSKAPNPKTNTQDQYPKGKEKGAPALTVADLMADGLTEETASEWIAYRRGKGSILKARAWQGIKTEAAKARITNEEAVCKAMARGWQGFEASWMADRGGGKQGALEARNRAVVEDFMRDTNEPH